MRSRWRRQAMYHLIDYGNAYEPDRAWRRAASSIQLLPIHPKRVKPELLESGPCRLPGQAEERRDVDHVYAGRNFPHLRRLRR
jgi:hypothetical protein